MKRSMAILLTCMSAALLQGCGGRGDQLEISGSVEVTRLRMSFQVAGSIESVRVDEGASVAAGDTLAVLDTIALSLEVEMRTAELAVQQAMLDGLEAGSRPQEIGRAAAGVEQAQAVLEQARQNYDRVTTLFGAGAVSRQEWESAGTALAVAEAGLASAGQSYSLASEGFRDTELQAALARVQASEASLALAADRLDNAVMTCPVDATVLTVTAEPGEHVAAGATVMTLGLLDTVEVIGWVAEPSLALIRTGQEAFVTCDGFPDTRFRGILSRISDEAEFTPSTVETREERVSLVYRITIQVPNPDGILKAGMPVDILMSIQESGR